jgi:hypothetical protein
MRAALLWLLGSGWSLFVTDVSRQFIGLIFKVKEFLKMGLDL